MSQKADVFFKHSVFVWGETGGMHSLASRISFSSTSLTARTYHIRIARVLKSGKGNYLH